MNELKKYKINNLISIKFKHNGSELIGLIPELDLYAFGNSVDEIVDELKMDITDLKDYYSEISSDKLGEEPKKWKELLSSV